MAQFSPPLLPPKALLQKHFCPNSPVSCFPQQKKQRKQSRSLVIRNRKIILHKIMCKMKSSSPVINSQIKQEIDDDEESLKPSAAGKSRTKIRKPKFLSLRSKIIPQIHAQKNRAPPKSSSSATISLSKTETMTSGMTTRSRQQQQQQQLNLFPLHPENLVDQQDDNVALFFQSDGGATLTGLLTSPTTTATTTTTTTMSSDLEEESLSPYAHYREKQGNIVRTAMRGRERDSTAAEKWVCYSDLVDMKEEVKEEMAEDCSTCTTANNNGEDGIHLVQQRRSRLALKLDYEEILNEWSGKGPLCIDGDPPQTVPDLLMLQDHQLFQVHDHTPNGSAGNSWRVPEGCGDDSVKTKTAEQREASVLRYKEKRQNRLFSKRIRYQVRKLNAEKRPRFKGRFVKTSS